MKEKRGKKRALRNFLIVAGVLAVFIVVVAAGGTALVAHEYGDRSEILQTVSAQPVKALVVYQPSITAASRDVAYSIAKGLNDAGYEVTISNPGKHLSIDISAYAVLVFGSPNYGSSVAQPLTDYVKQIKDFSGKKVILILHQGQSKSSRNLKSFLH